MFQPKSGFHPKEAWFRSPRWDEEAKADFEAHLARARPWRRVQYRRIKAAALLESGRPDWEAVGYEFFVQIAHDPDAANFEKVGAFSQLGAYDQEHRRLAEAERNLRLALATMTLNPSGSDGLEAIRLAEVLLALGGEARIMEARQLLEVRAQDPSIFVIGRFRLCVAATRVALASGRYQEAAAWADTALKLAVAKRSGLAKHPTLGLVDLDRRHRAWLTGVAEGTQTRDLPHAD